MTVRAPISVRIADGVIDRHVTRKVSDLKWRNTANGFTELSCNLALDPGEFSDLGAGDKIWVYDHTGRTLFEGFLDYPGASDSSVGRSLSLTAMGTTILAQDQRRALIYVDQDTGGWEQRIAGTSAPSSNANASDDPADADNSFGVDGLLTQLNPGQPIGSGANVGLIYKRVRDAGMTIGGIQVRVKSGTNDSGYRNDVVTYAGATTTSIPAVAGAGIFMALSSLLYYKAGDGTLPAGQDRVVLQLRRSGAATNVPSTVDTMWSWWRDVVIVGHRMTRNGTLLGPASIGTDPTVTAGGGTGVVADLVGRCFGSLIDNTSSRIEDTTWAIDQLAYPDGTTPGDVLDDLALWEPDYLWELLEHTGIGYRFNYRRWPSSARYEISSREGYEAPGSDVELCNRIAVRWTDSRGRDRTTVVTADSDTYPELSALEQQGRIKDAEPIDLPDGFGSAANAQRIGAQALALVAQSSKAAKATVRKPVIDLLRGGQVAPHQIEPGYLVRVRETGDLLRLTEVDYDDSAGAVTLTLGTPFRTIEQRLARLSKVRPKRGRRAA